MPFPSVQPSGGVLWSTDPYPALERCAYWREAVCREFVALDPVPRCPERSFYGRIQSRSLGPLTIADIRAAAQLVRRGPREIDHTPGSYYYLITQVAGVGHIEQFGERVSLLAGDAAIVDPRYPYALSFDDEFRQLNLSIPIDCVSKLCRNRAPVGVPLKNVGPLLSAYLNVLNIPRENTGGDYYELAIANIMEMISLLGSHVPLRRRETDQRLQKITCYIRDNYRDPLLCPARAAAASNVSVRLLHKLFADSGLTFGGCLRTLRLEQARLELARASRGLSVTDIAMDNGFESLSSFSRAFRQRFGMSPTEYQKKLKLQ